MNAQLSPIEDDRIVTHPMLCRVCARCVHFGGFSDAESTKTLIPITCEAFPKGIPERLWKRGEHTTPYPGDNGIRFEPKEGT